MRRQAFTLIELLVVIAIIAILAAILFPVFAKAREKARQAACMSNMKNIALAALQYAQDYDEMWPGGANGAAFMSPTGPGGLLVNWGWNAVCGTPPAPGVDGSPQCRYGALNVASRRRGYVATWQGGGFALIRPYVKTDEVFTCPNQQRVDAANAGGSNVPNQAAGWRFEIGYNINFQWLGTQARIAHPAQKVMFIENYNTHDSGAPLRRYCCDGPGVVDQIAFCDGHVKLMRLDRGCAKASVRANNPACAGWYACNSATCCPENYGCSGASGDVPDFP